MKRKEPKNEQAICKGLMRLIGERRGESVTPTGQPEVNERNKPAVEWLFETPTAQFAIEHGSGSGLLIFQGLGNNVAELRRDRIREALNRKCPKLHAEQQTGRVSVLALESDDMPFMQHTTIAEAVVQALGSRTDRPDMIFWVRTTTRPWLTWLLKDGDVLYPNVPNDSPFVIL